MGSFWKPVEALQNAFGKSPLRFSFEITPKSVDCLPAEVTAVSVVWEKGSKVSYTDAMHVNPSNGQAEFSQVMRQTTTIYKQANKLLPKSFTFKVQAVHMAEPGSRGSSTSSTVSLPLRDGRRKTVARARLDLAQFCSAESHPSKATEVEVPLEPAGTLYLSIKAVWLQHYDKPQPPQHDRCSPSRNFAHSWGSRSEADNSTDVSSVTSSWRGTPLCDVGRDDVATGSAELDRLIAEAEAATAAKAVIPTGAKKAVAAHALNLAKPRVLTLACLSTARKGLGNSTTANRRSLDVLVSLQQPRQAVLGRSVLTFLSRSDDGAASCCSSTSGTPACSRAHPNVDICAPGFFTATHAGSKKWHRRASSVPETATIQEADKEGLDSNSFTAGAPPQAQDSNTSTCSSTLPQQKDSSSPFAEYAPASRQQNAGALDNDTFEDGADEDTSLAGWCDVPAALAASSRAAEQPGVAASRMNDGPENLRSLSGRMPMWLWPSSRLAVRDLTTDDIMRRISGSRDISALQHMCRGLLCERNDWRFRATQAERTNKSLQQELQQVRESGNAATAALQLQEQKSEGQVLHKLVEAKVQLAQADLAMQDLKGQLERERKRHLQALAKLTSLQSNFDQYIHEQQAILKKLNIQPQTVVRHL